MQKLAIELYGKNEISYEAYVAMMAEAEKDKMAEARGAYALLLEEESLETANKFLEVLNSNFDRYFGSTNIVETTTDRKVNMKLRYESKINEEIIKTNFKFTEVLDSFTVIVEVFAYVDGVNISVTDTKIVI